MTEGSEDAIKQRKMQRREVTLCGSDSGERTESPSESTGKDADFGDREVKGK